MTDFVDYDHDFKRRFLNDMCSMCERCGARLWAPRTKGSPYFYILAPSGKHIRIKTLPRSCADARDVVRELALSVTVMES